MFALVCFLPLVLLLSSILTLQVERVHESAKVVTSDSVFYGMRTYSHAFAAYMNTQGSYAQGIFPQSASDLAPYGLYTPQTPNGGSWTVGVSNSSGSNSPYVCLSTTASGFDSLSALQQGAAAAHARVLAGADCTAMATPSTAIPAAPAFPLNVVVVKHFDNKPAGVGRAGVVQYAASTASASGTAAQSNPASSTSSASSPSSASGTSSTSNQGNNNQGNNNQGNNNQGNNNQGNNNHQGNNNNN